MSQPRPIVRGLRSVPAGIDVTPVGAARELSLTAGCENAGLFDPVLTFDAALEVDDLKRIRGIGVLIEKKLNSMGVTGYDQIANWSAGDIERVYARIETFRNQCIKAASAARPLQPVPSR